MMRRRENGVLFCVVTEAAGGIDLQLLGIGRDGHVGFNEPPSSEVLSTISLFHQTLPLRLLLCFMLLHLFLSLHTCIHNLALSNTTCTFRSR